VINRSTEGPSTAISGTAHRPSAGDSVRVLTSIYDAGSESGYFRPP